MRRFMEDVDTDDDKISFLYLTWINPLKIQLQEKLPTFDGSK